MTYAQALRRLLSENGMTQYALAKAVNKSRSYISELCSGKIAESNFMRRLPAAQCSASTLSNTFKRIRLR